MKHIYLYLALFLLSVLYVGCKSEETFDNKLFYNETALTNVMSIKEGYLSDITKILQVALPKPATSTVTANFVVNKSMLNTYNLSYNANAVLLPDSCYSINNPQVKILPDSVESEKAAVKFSNLSSLSRNIVYVLPVSIQCSDVDILTSSSTYYYIIKVGADINVVADIENNFCTVNWVNPSVVNNLSQVTMEALIRARDFNHTISSVMGIEGNLLIRIGDAGIPSNQVQIATSKSIDFSKKGPVLLPTNKWLHIALTYDSSKKEIKLYVNGTVELEGKLDIGTVSLGYSGLKGFCIGRSYDSNRYLSGNISECRIWNVVRTQKEISDHMYLLDADTAGLVAYWKFDDKSVNRVKDYTSNGNDATSFDALVWTNVSLPEKDN